MKKQNISLIILSITLVLSLILLSSNVSANLGTFKANDCVNIKTILNSTYANVSTISYPNSSIVITNKAMTKQGYTFNYSFCNTTTLGTYTYDYFDDSGNVYVNSFDVTPTGNQLTTSQSVTYIIIFIIGLLILAALLVVGIFMPSKNNSNEMTGYIIAVNNLKYLKFFSIMFAYLVAMGIAFFSYSISYSYLDFPFISSFSYFIFYGMAGGCFIFFPIMTYFLIANWNRDNQIAELLSRGLKTKGI